MLGVLKVTIAESYTPRDLDLPEDCSEEEFKIAIRQELINDPLYGHLMPLIEDYKITIKEED